MQQAGENRAERLTSSGHVLTVKSLRLFRSPSSPGKSGHGAFLEGIPGISAVLCFEELVLDHYRG